MRKLAIILALCIATAAHAQNPTGVFAVNNTTATNAYLIPQANVAGQVVFVSWGCVNTASGVYNFNNNSGSGPSACTGIETAIGAPLCDGSNPTTCFGAGNTTACMAANGSGNPTWGCAGKQTALVIWPVSDGPHNYATPQWVWNLLQGPPYCTVGSFNCGITCAPATGDNIPNYVATNFKTSYTTFLAAILNQYKNDSRIAYIRVGIGNGGESSPPCPTPMQLAYGINEVQWITYAEVVLTAEAANLGSVPFQLGLSCYTHPCASDYQLPDSLAAYAIQNGINVGHEELSTADMTTYWAGIGSASICDADFCGIFSGIPASGALDGNKTQKWHTVFKNEQFNAATCPNPNDQSGTNQHGQPCKGSPITLLPFISTLHVSTMEIVAASDLTIAYGITGPGSACNVICYPGGRAGSCSSSPPYCPFTPGYQSAISYFISTSANSRSIGLPTVNRP